MASASDIGASFSQYKGDVGLGSGDFGVVKIDTQPIMDLARYTFLYNKSEYDQRQKDVEAAAEELASSTSYDLTTGIKKDASLLKEKYDNIQKFIRENPDALKYKNTGQWQKYREMKGDLENDIKSAKVRNTMNAIREKKIADTTDEATKKLLRKELDKDINDTDIRTPLPHDQKYKENNVVLPSAESLSLDFDVNQVGGNTTVSRKQKVFNLDRAWRNGDVFAITGMDDINPETAQGARDLISKKSNLWVQGSEIIKSVVNEKNTDGSYKFKTKNTDANGNITYSLDESKLPPLALDVLNDVKNYNTYVRGEKEKVRNGFYKDRFENGVSLGSAINSSYYKEINYQDGIDPTELAVAAQFKNWEGDSYTTKVDDHNRAVTLSGQENARKMNESDNANARWIAKFNAANKGESNGGSSNEDISNVNSVLSEVASIINNGANAATSGFIGSLVGGGKSNVFTVSDPTVMKEFSTIDKDGKTTMPPNEVKYDKGKDEFILVYTKSAEGEDLAEPREQRLNGQTYIKNKVKQSFPNKDIGTINSIISNIYTKEKSLYNISQRYKDGGNSESTPPANTKVSKITVKGL